MLQDDIEKILSEPTVMRYGHIGYGHICRHDDHFLCECRITYFAKAIAKHVNQLTDGYLESKS